MSILDNFIRFQKISKEKLEGGKVVNLGSCQKEKCRLEERAMSFELSQPGVRKESEQGMLSVRESMLRTETE